MQSQSDREFQENVMNFRKNLRGKTTWADFEEYVGHKMDEGDRIKRFVLNYLNRDFEQPYDDDQQCITTRIICKRDEQGYLKVLDREAIRQRRADYYEANKETIKQRKAEYHQRNRETINRRHAECYQRNKQSKKFCCDSCKIVCGSNRDLQRHLKTERHLQNESKI